MIHESPKARSGQFPTAWHVYVTSTHLAMFTGTTSSHSSSHTSIKPENKHKPRLQTIYPVQTDSASRCHTYLHRTTQTLPQNRTHCQPTSTSASSPPNRTISDDATPSSHLMPPSPASPASSAPSPASHSSPCAPSASPVAAHASALPPLCRRMKSLWR